MSTLKNILQITYCIYHTLESILSKQSQFYSMEMMCNGNIFILLEIRAHATVLHIAPLFYHNQFWHVHDENFLKLV